MPLKLTEYLPDPNDLDPSAIIETRKRLQAYLQDFWPELDTRPNSVFGDVYLTPMATMMTSLEVAMQRFKSDLDLTNVANGIIYDVDFIKAYLKNFGVSTTEAINASGTIKLVFNADKEYILDSSTTFSFGDAIFFVNPEEGNPIYIKPTSEPNAKRLLTKTGENQFEVYIPITGTPGTTVNDGDQALISVEIPELVSSTAVGGFDPGKPTDSIITLAAKAQKQFAAASLTSRSGVISFTSNRWPNLLAVSATVTGDREMLRSGVNPLGIYEGAVDLFVKSRATYASGESLVRLTYDTEREAWIGKLTIPVVPAFYALTEGIFQTNNFQTNRGVNKVYARSTHPTVDSVAISYSRYETLGIAIQDTNPVDFTPAVTGQVTAKSATTTQLQVRGEYNGSLFSQYGNRSVTIRFDGETVIEGLPAVIANVRDSISGEVGVVYFVANAETGATKGLILKTSPGYKAMFNGMDLDIVPATATFVPSDVVGLEYTFAYSGRTANFSVNYLYDPFLVQIDNVIGNPDHKPVNVDPLARNFIMCHVSLFTVNYRVRYGQRLDVDAATDEIVTYLNSLGYPNQYEDSAISNIIAKHGASGLQSIAKKGYFYPSLATVFVDKNGNEVSVPRVETNTLIPALNDYGFGQRNIGYLIDRDTITFNGTAY